MIAENLAVVRAAMAAAAGRAGRAPGAITLIAVSKTFDADCVRAAWQAGQRDFGENKIQEGSEKIAATAALAGARWHLIGHLQSNKAKRAAAGFGAIHTIDSVELLQRVDQAAVAAGTRPDVLIQVDLALEPTKFGAPAGAVDAIARRALDARGVRLVGLMLVPPWHEDQEVTRPWFAQLRGLRDRLVAGGLPAASLAQLSMGMSHDFEAAIEEGATMVRIGSAIFGARTAPR